MEAGMMRRKKMKKFIPADGLGRGWKFVMVGHGVTFAVGLCAAAQEFSEKTEPGNFSLLLFLFSSSSL